MEGFETGYVQNLSESVVREYLYRKGLRRTLQSMDTELPRSSESLNSRHLIVEELDIKHLLDANKLRSHPFRSIIEVVLYDLLKARGRLLENKSKHRQNCSNGSVEVISRWPQIVRKQLTTPGIRCDSAVYKRNKHLSLAQILQKTLLQKRKCVHVTSFYELNCGCVYRRGNNDVLADLDCFLTNFATRGRFRASDVEDVQQSSSKEYEDIVQANYEYNNSHRRVYPPRQNSGILKEKEHVLLESIDDSNSSRLYDNRTRLGPEKENTFQCLKRSRSTSAMEKELNSSLNMTTSVKQQEKSLKTKSKSDIMPVPVTRNEDNVKENENEGEQDHLIVIDKVENRIEENAVALPEPCQVLNSIENNTSFNDRQLTVTLPNETIVADDKLPTTRLCSSPNNNTSNNNNNNNNNPNDNEVEISVINEHVTEELVNSDIRGHIFTEEELSCFLLDGDANDVVKDVELEEDYGFEECEDDSVFVPIKLSAAVELKKLLIGSGKSRFSQQWLGQSFIPNSNPKLRYGFVQNKGGCCGVLATVQAFLLRALLFDPNTIASCTEPLRPTKKEVRNALVQAICDILWQAGQCQQAVLARYTEEEHLKDGPYYCKDGITECLSYKKFLVKKDLHEAIESHLEMFTFAGGKGCLMFVFSVLLSRGLQSVLGDMDDETCSLIGRNGTCSLELVNLILTGRAVSNVFDNNLQLGSCLLRGVSRRSDIGLLSLYEHYNSCQVGTNLKTPRYPIWLVNSENHFSVIYSPRKELVSDWRAERQFQLFHYDGMSNNLDDTVLNIDTTGLYLSPPGDLENIPPLEHCIRTKWKDAIIKRSNNP